MLVCIKDGRVEKGVDFGAENVVLRLRSAAYLFTLKRLMLSMW